MRILYLLARQFRQLMQTKEMLEEGKGQQEISRILGVPGFAARNYVKCVRSYGKEELRQAVEDLHIPHDPSVSEWVTVSIGGITIIPKADKSYEFYLKMADAMLYDAKKMGRNRVVWADEKIKQLCEK